MKKWILCTLLALVFLPMQAQALPDIAIQNADGSTVRTQSFVDGKTPFAVTFWASWCKPCQKELDALSEACPDWDGTFPLRIYAVSVDDSRSLSRAKALFEGQDWPCTGLYDPNSDFARAMNVSSIPHVFVFDKDGKQVYTHVGYIPGDEESLLDEIRKAAR